MLCGIVAKPSPPEEAPDDAEYPEGPKGLAPSGAINHGPDKQWCDRATQPGSGEDDPVGGSPFLKRKPSRKTSRHVGEGSRFTGAEEEPRDQERNVVPDGAGRHRER